jgi:hypothetical protein
MTLEQARKRRDQGDLIDELVGALEKFIAEAEEVNSCAENGYTTAVGDIVIADARVVLAKAKEHDCIPWDDAKEVSQQ